MKKLYAGNVLSPLPVVLVGANVGGRPNYLVVGYIAPFDFGRRVFFSIFKKRYTAGGILENRTFSVNVPSANLIDRIAICGSKSGRDFDKSALFDTFYGKLETAPMIGECPLSMECEVTDLIDTEQNLGVIGRVVQSHVDERLLKDEKTIDMVKADLLVWTLGGDSGYYRLGERVEEPKAE
jgi:flavin reductase (DIM6/NTAB) family NADH-FMN oxidoreductase RutF